MWSGAEITLHLYARQSQDLQTMKKSLKTLKARSDVIIEIYGPANRALTLSR